MLSAIFLLPIFVIFSTFPASKSQNDTCDVDRFDCLSPGIDPVLIDSVPLTTQSSQENTTLIETAVVSPLLLHHDCIEDLSLFVSDEVYLSYDNFRTPCKPLSTRDDFHMGAVSDAVLVNNHTVLIGDGEVVVYDIYQRTFTEAKGIEHGESVTDLSTFFCCAQATSWCLELSNIVLAYNRHVDTSEFFLSRDGGLTFTEKDLPDKYHGQIYGMSVTITFQSIKILVKVNPTKASILSMTYSVVELPLKDPLVTNVKVAPGELHMSQVKSGFGSFLLWDENTMFYSPNGGQTISEVPLNVRENTNSTKFLQSGETFREVISTMDGNFAALTTKQRIFFGREGFKVEAMEVYDHGAVITEKSVVIFDKGGDITVLTPNINKNVHPFFQTQTIDIKSAVNKFRPALETCPLQILSGTYHQNVLYLDNKEDLTLETTLTRTTADNQIIVSASNPGVVSLETTYIKKSTHLELHDTVKTIFRQKATEFEVHAAGGLTSIRTSTVRSSLACNKNPELVAHVSVGCRPTKHIKIRSTTTRCDDMKNFTYNIPADMYDPTFLGGKADHDKTVQYDYLNLRCPHKVYHMENLRPIIDLYDGDTFLREVKADFIVYEIHGMNTFGYAKRLSGLTECKRTPQQWKKMRARQKVGTDPGTHWTRMNYCDCKVRGECHLHDDAGGGEEDGHGHGGGHGGGHGEEEEEEGGHHGEEEEDHHGEEDEDDDHHGEEEEDEDHHGEEEEDEDHHGEEEDEDHHGEEEEKEEDHHGEKEEKEEDHHEEEEKEEDHHEEEEKEEDHHGEEEEKDEDHHEEEKDEDHHEEEEKEEGHHEEEENEEEDHHEEEEKEEDHHEEEEKEEDHHEEEEKEEEDHHEEEEKEEDHHEEEEKEEDHHEDEEKEEEDHHEEEEKEEDHHEEEEKEDEDHHEEEKEEEDHHEEEKEEEDHHGEEEEDEDHHGEEEEDEDEDHHEEEEKEEDHHGEEEEDEDHHGEEEEDEDEDHHGEEKEDEDHHGEEKEEEDHHGEKEEEDHHGEEDEDEDHHGEEEEEDEDHHGEEEGGHEEEGGGHGEEGGGHGHGGEEEEEGHDHEATFESDSQEYYEILNAEYDNALTFEGHNGIYVFEVIIVDAQYSFCDLRTRFAVHVFGASPKSTIPTLVITGGLILTSLVVIYVIFITMIENKRAVLKWRHEAEKLRRLKIPHLEQTTDS